MKKTRLLFAIIASMVLCSCSGGGNNPGPIEDPELPTNLKGSEWFQYYGERENVRSLPSKGERNVLVVPMTFRDEKKPMSTYSTSVLKDLTNVYTGGEGTTSFYSVKEYYEKASYGKLKLNIDVVQTWCKLDKSLQELYDMGKSEMADQSWYAINYAANWYQENYGDISKYDTDKDGFIDSIIVIFSHDAYTKKTWPYLDGVPTEAEKALAWAYTFWTYKNEPNMEVPSTNAYNWISYGYIDEGKTKKPDPHTYIHEFGHLLGLTDYYDYDFQEDNGRFAPAGKVNMMDYNVGDQDSYSKFLLGWTKPTVIKEAQEVTIRPFESSGECILVPTSSDYENSPLDEYLLVDLYTPTGLNYEDSLRSAEPRTFSEVGVKIYHVDSRLGKIHWNEEKQESTFIEFVDKPTYEYLSENGQAPYYYDIVPSNTESYCLSSTEFKRLNLLSSSEGSVNNNYYYNRGANNSDLYKAEDSLGAFEFNNGKKLNFKIDFISISNEEAKIAFSIVE